MKRYIFLSFVGLLLFASCRNSLKTSYEVGERQQYWGHHFSQAYDVAYGDLPDQKMDIYSRGNWIGEPDYWRSDTINHKTLVYIHGGGWLGGTKNQITPFIIAYLERGWNVVTLEYRKGSGTAPRAVDDCMKALSWLADHASPYNIDNDNIVISGESAGGHLALITGILNAIPGSHPFYSGDKLKIRAIVNWFGITDIAAIDKYYSEKGEKSNYANIWVGNAHRMDSISKVFSPVNRVNSHTPPIITIHGKLDTAVPYEQAIHLKQVLDKAGIRNELLSFDDARHLGFTDEQFQEIYARIFYFIDPLMTTRIK